jgi:hypothetical protein
MADPTPEQVRAVAEVLCGDGFDDRRAYCATHLYGGVAQIGACCREGRETAERILAAVRTDPAVQDAMLAALAEGGRLVEERRQPCSCGSVESGRRYFLHDGHLLADAHTSLRERARYVTHWREVPDAD